MQHFAPKRWLSARDICADSLSPTGHSHASDPSKKTLLFFLLFYSSVPTSPFSLLAPFLLPELHYSLLRMDIQWQTHSVRSRSKCLFLTFVFWRPDGAADGGENDTNKSVGVGERKKMKASPGKHHLGLDVFLCKCFILNKLMISLFPIEKQFCLFSLNCSHCYMRANQNLKRKFLSSALEVIELILRYFSSQGSSVQPAPFLTGFDPFSCCWWRSCNTSPHRSHRLV